MSKEKVILNASENRRDIKAETLNRTPGTAIVFILHNFEMKEEIYCFVIFMIAKYGQFYVIIGPNIASRGIRTKHLFKGDVWA